MRVYAHTTLGERGVRSAAARLQAPVAVPALGGVGGGPRPANGAPQRARAHRPRVPPGIA